jgi:Ca2+-binding EF-hand superfamily protein
MHASHLITAAALCASLLAVAAAQPGLDLGGPAGDAPEFDRPERPGLIERLDTNGDGAVTQEEIDAARAEREARRAERADRMAERVLERFDVDASGALDAEELSAMFDAAPRRAARAGRDGLRGQGPGAQGNGKRGMGMRGPRGAAFREGMLERFDLDADGSLSEDERSAMRTEMEQRRAEMVARFDADGDGVLTRGERRAARGFAAAQRHVRRADLDGDGILSADELNAALTLIDEGDRTADFNGDRMVNEDDAKAIAALVGTKLD